MICQYFHFLMITLVNINGFSPNLVSALILCRPGLGLLMGKFCQFLTVLSAHNTSILCLHLPKGGGGGDILFFGVGVKLLVRSVTRIPFGIF